MVPGEVVAWLGLFYSGFMKVFMEGFHGGGMLTVVDVATIVALWTKCGSLDWSCWRFMEEFISY